MVELRVREMTCGHCLAAVTAAVTALDPEAEVQADVSSGRIRVKGRRAVNELIDALGAAGYRTALNHG